MGSTLRSRAPQIMRLIACLDGLSEESLGQIFNGAFGAREELATLSDEEFVHRVERYLKFRRGAIG